MHILIAEERWSLGTNNNEKNNLPDFKGTLTPSESVDKVLGISAGKSAKLGIKAGGLVSF